MKVNTPIACCSRRARTPRARRARRRRAAPAPKADAEAAAGAAAASLPRRRAATRAAGGRGPQRSRARGGDARLRVPAGAAHGGRRRASTSRAVKGSGPHGRIVKADIEAALARRPTPAPRCRAASRRPPLPAPAPARAAAASDPRRRRLREIPLIDSMRKVIARAPDRGQADDPALLPDASTASSTRCCAARRSSTRREQADYKLSVNDFVIKAVALALQQGAGLPTPSWAGDKIYIKDVDVSVAVAIEGGLITPIIRNADQKALSTHLDRDEGPRRRAPRTASSSPRSSRAAASRSPISACSASRTSCGDQPAAGLHPGGRRRREAAGRSRAARSTIATVMSVHALDRSPRGRRRPGRRSSCRSSRGSSRTRWRCCSRRPTFSSTFGEADERAHQHQRARGEPAVFGAAGEGGKRRSAAS